MSADIINEGETVPPGSSSGQADSRSPVIQWIQITVLTLLVGCIFFGIGWWRSGAMATSWAYLQGERLLFTPANIIIENAKPGEVVERTIVVKNLSDKTITLLGSQESCGCITLQKFPIEISAGKKHEILIKINIDNDATSLENNIKIYTDHDGLATVTINISGNVKGG